MRNKSAAIAVIISLIAYIALPAAAGAAARRVSYPSLRTALDRVAFDDASDAVKSFSVFSRTACAVFRDWRAVSDVADSVKTFSVFTRTIYMISQDLREFLTAVKDKDYIRAFRVLVRLCEKLANAEEKRSAPDEGDDLKNLEIDTTLPGTFSL